ncbi:class I SAM-dependent methyltransferase [bacterium]|jgi:2-polyprenyl-3-methyl-5-hydroxy-6-metoxy-1,4-benzoquinol methylase|nr:class I SAM-dependent methyltransferase [bacterium]
MENGSEADPSYLRTPKVQSTPVTEEILSDEDWLRRLVAERAYQYLESDFSSPLPPHIHKYVWGTVFREIKRYAPTGRILDAGCGNGAFCGELARQSKHQVCGMDLSKTGIEIARRFFPDVSFKLASVNEDIISVFDEPFDAIVSLEVIEHLYDPRGFVESLYQGLRPGGVLILSTPYHGYWKNLALALTNRLDPHFTALWDGGRIKFWSRPTLTKLLTSKGFRILNFAGCGRVPYLWKSMVITAQRPSATT